VQYRECAPLPALAPFVEKVWTLEGRATPGDPPQPVMPDGRPEIVIHFGDRFALVAGAGVTLQPRIIYAGQLPSQLLLQPTGRIAIAGIRFHPHGAAALLRVPQHRLLGPPLPLEDLDPTLTRALAEIQDRCVDLERAARLAQAVILRWITADRIDARVAHAVDLISRARGRVAIERVAASAGATRRHLETRFLDQVGLTPKRLARLARFQYALQLLEMDDACTGADAAAACGYADQAHFIRDFKSLAGCPPTEHLLRRAELTRLFVTASST
jgi:AraC-like DNA-binding protein